jgi:para-aminobenzoate synthetase component 1
VATYPAIIKEIACPSSPREAYARLRSRPGAVLLESGLHDGGLGRWSFLACDPFLTFRSKGSRIELTTGEGTQVQDGDPFALLAQLLREIHVPRPPGAPPLLCGAMGYFGYDLGRSL